MDDDDLVTIVIKKVYADGDEEISKTIKNVRSFIYNWNDGGLTIIHKWGKTIKQRYVELDEYEKFEVIPQTIYE